MKSADIAQAARDEVRAALALKSADIDRLTAAHLNGKFGESLGLLGYLRHFPRGEGVRLWDDEGREYLDFLAGYGSVPVGHNHPAVAAAVDEVMKSQVPHFLLIAPEALPAALGKRLAGLCPGDLGMSFFASSGSEAVDGALKLARAATRRARFVHACGGYHGATFGAMSVTGDEGKRRPFAPLLADVTEVPWGEVAPIDAALRKRDVAAVILEPIQAEGGIRLPPPGWLAEVARLCHKTGTLLVLDEVQTGLGRCGTFLACEREQVIPDVVVLAKALSGGLVPISAYVTRPDVWTRAYGTLTRCELHCTTFRGGPLACAAALATLEVIEREALTPRAARLGERLGALLRDATAGHRGVKEVRGRGLLWGIELATGLPSPAAPLAAQHVVVGLLERGFVTQVCSMAPTVVRVEPSLVVEEAHLEAFAAALREVLATHARGALSTAVAVGGKLLRNVLGGSP